MAAKLAVVKVKGCVERRMKVGLTAADWPNGGDGELEVGDMPRGSLMGMKTWASGLKLFLISLSNSSPFSLLSST